jgi:hypothetical protein
MEVLSGLIRNPGLILHLSKKLKDGHLRVYKSKYEMILH